MILRAAERLIEHYGLSKTTIADIAREASIGVGTVYLEFGSKDDIIGQLADAKYAKVLQALQQAARTPQAPADVRLRALLDVRVRMFRKFASIGMHAPDMLHCSCEAVTHRWRRYCLSELQLLVEVLEEGARAGTFVVADAPQTARAVLDAYRVFGPPWTRTLEMEDFEVRLSTLHDLVVRGVTR